MKKLYLFTFLTFVASLAMAQNYEIYGTVSDEDGPISGADVFVMAFSTTIEPGDTIGTTVTDANGLYSVVVDLSDDSLYVTVSSSACPNIFNSSVVNGDGVFLPINCSEDDLPGDSIPEVMYLAGVPINENGNEWYFFSSVFGEAASYDWTIDGNNFNSENVIYSFLEPGTYTVSLSVEMASGNVLTDEMSVNIINAPNCQALFFPYVDSLNPNELAFINASIGDDLTYFWNFGDGNGSYEPYPTHQFEDSLEYEICLTISSESCDDTFCLTVSPSNISGWTGSGIVVGGDGISPNERTQSQAKDGNGYEFVVIPPPTAPLSSESLEFEIELSLYPNPTDGNTFLSFYSEKSEFAQLRLMDMTGKLVSQESVNINSGENQLNLDFSKITEGVYIMFFESASKQRGVTKIVIQ